MSAPQNFDKSFSNVIVRSKIVVYVVCNRYKCYCNIINYLRRYFTLFFKRTRGLFLLKIKKKLDQSQRQHKNKVYEVASFLCRLL